MDFKLEFKAWDPENRIMIHDKKDIPIYYEDDNGFHSGKACKVSGWIPYSLKYFTGLLDCNGVKVFSDDVLSSFHFEDAEGGRHFLYHQVVWNEKHLCWQAESLSDIDSEHGSPDLWVYARNTDFVNIGSIHENNGMFRRYYA